jgi:hypothetical protein
MTNVIVELKRPLDESRFQRWFCMGRFPGAVPQAEMMKRRWRASLCGLIAPGVAPGWREEAPLALVCVGPIVLGVTQAHMKTAPFGAKEGRAGLASLPAGGILRILVSCCRCWKDLSS